MPSLPSIASCLFAALLLLLPGLGSASAQCRGDDLFAVEAAGWSEELRRRAGAMANREGRFWRVSRGDGAPSYLFGTLHVSDARVARLPAPVADRIRQASVLAVETTEMSSLGLGRPGPNARNDLRATIRAPQDRRAGALLEPSDYEALRKLAADRKLPPSAARTWTASALALLLDLPACARAGGEKRPYLDALVVQAAREGGVEIVGLETLAEQFGVFDGLSPETERALLVSVLRQAAHGESALESQIVRFLARDGGGIVALMQVGPTPDIPDSQTPPAFLERLLATRTARMAERIRPLLERGNAVVAVGIAHLPGQDGLVALLQSAGYTLSVVD